jgi:hypothetical protein
MLSYHSYLIGHKNSFTYRKLVEDRLELHLRDFSDHTTSLTRLGKEGFQGEGTATN